MSEVHSSERLGDKSLAKPGRSYSHRLLMAGKSLISILLSSVACLVLLVALLEFILAIFGLGNDEYLKIDPILGSTHLDKKLVTFRFEGYSREKINKDGDRDYERKLLKAPGVTRIAFLGDSMTEAAQVPLDCSFVRVSERKLNAMSAGTFETMNFAMASYGTVQEYVQFLLRVRAYKPDVTVLVYNYGDSGENLSTSNEDVAPRPLVSIGNDGKLDLTFDFLDRWIALPQTQFALKTEWLRRHSHIVQTLLASDLFFRSNSKWYSPICRSIYSSVSPVISWLIAGLPEPPELAPYYRAVGRPAGDLAANQAVRLDTSRVRRRLRAETARLDSLIAHNLPDNPRIDVSQGLSAETLAYRTYAQMHYRNFAATARVLKMLNTACREAGSQFVIVTLPAADSFKFYLREIQHLKKLGEAEGFQVIDANESFPRVNILEKNPYYYGAHFTKRGHAVMADIISGSLIRMLSTQASQSR
ncbi:MAG TPA: hypothetical protein V6D17_23185 [Candidatus Obscuribacterales bacterium]